jgi:hypothetical protein
MNDKGLEGVEVNRMVDDEPIWSERKPQKS